MDVILMLSHCIQVKSLTVLVTIILLNNAIRTIILGIGNLDYLFLDQGKREDYFFLLSSLGRKTCYGQADASGTDAGDGISICYGFSYFHTAKLMRLCFTLDESGFTHLIYYLF